MTIFSRSNNRITKDHPIRPYHFRLYPQSPIQPFPIPEHAQTACQMPACRKARNSDPVHIHIPLIPMLPYHLHSKSQLHQSPRKHIRRQTVMKHKNMKTSSQILHSDGLVFSGRKCTVSAAWAKQHSRPLFIQNTIHRFQNISSKIRRTTENRLFSLFRSNFNRNMLNHHIRNLLPKMQKDGHAL